MKVYVHDSVLHRSMRPRAAASGLPPLAPGTDWVRFGRQTLLYNDEADTGSDAAPRAPSRGARFARREADATRDQLHVVVQHGRLFQQQHPDVPVLHDRGRFLLVQLDPDRARRLQAEHPCCFGVMPVSAELVVFDEPERVSSRAAAVPFIKTLTAALTRPLVESTLTKLVSFGTRNSTSAGHTAAADFARGQLDAMGYTTSVQKVSVGAGTTRNVIADKRGTGPAPRRVVIVSAHLDSINQAGGPGAPAPGADDNGSGSTGVIEMARVFAHHDSRHDLRFILFSGEEQGLFGSKHYVATLPAAKRSRIIGVVNMDMVGSLNSPTASVLLEGAAVSSAMINHLADAAATYTGLAVERSLHPFASDHVPFIDAAIPAVLTIEGADNTNSTVHSAQDTLDHINYDLLLDILRMNVAFVAGALARSS